MEDSVWLFDDKLHLDLGFERLIDCSLSLVVVPRATDRSTTREAALQLQVESEEFNITLSVLILVFETVSHSSSCSKAMMSTASRRNG